MINFLYIDGVVVRPTPEILQVPPFKEIWERDESEKKEIALGEFTFIKYMCHPGKENPYYGYAPDIREQKILTSLKLDINPSDPFIIEAIAFFLNVIEDASPLKRFYDSCLMGCEKLIYFLNTVNLEERDARGSAIYKPNDVKVVLKDAYETMQSLASMKDKVETEVYEAGVKTRGNRQIGKYEVKKEFRDR